MKVFIYAFEDKYGGLHGISDQAVVGVADMEEANSIGNEMAWSVIESYGHLFEDYDEGDEDEFEEESGTEWFIYKIRDDINLSVEELDNICALEDWESFVEEYCEKEALI